MKSFLTFKNHSIIESCNLFNKLYYIYISFILKFCRNYLIYFKYSENSHTSLKAWYLSFRIFVYSSNLSPCKIQKRKTVNTQTTCRTVAIRFRLFFAFLFSFFSFWFFGFLVRRRRFRFARTGLLFYRDMLI